MDKEHLMPRTLKGRCVLQKVLGVEFQGKKLKQSNEHFHYTCMDYFQTKYS